jgi:hypothetical protein
MQRTKTRSSATTKSVPLSMLGKVMQTTRVTEKPVIKEPIKIQSSAVKYGSNISDSVVSVTPALAKEWLATNISNNRSVVQSKVKKWAKSMALGEWGLAESIKFDKNGKLFDGQHRLLAVIDSGLTVDFVVSYGYDPEAAQLVDLGMSRRLEHIAQLQGKKLTSSYTAIMRAMLIPCPKYYNQKNLISHQAMIELIEEYMPYIEYALKVVPRKSDFLNKASFLAALARAAYFYNVIDNPDSNEAERLNQARVIMKTGMTVEAEDTALLKLRDWLNCGKGITNTSSNRIYVYNLSDYYLWLFMNKKPRKNMALPEGYTASMLVPPLQKMFG